MTTEYTRAAFIRDVNARFAIGSPATFWSCEGSVAEFLRCGIAEEWLNELLGRLTQQPDYSGDWRANEIFLHRDDAWSISVGLLDGRNRFIHVLPFLAFYAPLGDTVLLGQRYRLPPNHDSELFDPSAALTPDGSFSVQGFEPLLLDTSRFAYDFHVPQPIPVVRIATRSVRPLEWLFTKSTLRAWQANDAELRYTQLRVAAYVLGRVAHQSSIDPLRKLSSHPHHSVRWAAIQNLGRLSRSEALIKIREATQDPHPHVRRAAQRTLEQLNQNRD